MEADVAVLTAGGVAAALRVVREGVDGAEVPADAAELGLEDLVEEAGLELAGAAVRGGDLEGLLATRDADLVAEGRDGRRVDVALRLVGLDAGERGGLEQLGRRVLGGCDEVGQVGRELDVLDLVRVDADGLERLLAGRRIPEAQGAVLVARQDRLVAVRPGDDRRLLLRVRELDLQPRGGCISSPLVDQQHRGLAHRGIRDQGQQLVAHREGEPAHGRLRLDLVQAPARGDVPEADAVVGAAARQDARVRGHVHRPDGPVVPHEAAEQLAVVGVPHVRRVVLGR